MILTNYTLIAHIFNYIHTLYKITEDKKNIR